MSRVWVIEYAHHDIDDTSWNIAHVASSKKLADAYIAKQPVWEQDYYYVTDYVVDEGAS